ncbi:MAG: hypothetical protein KatS3mg108_0939 [Isosphaeraceae bacterium]|jgi:hypothetical protein|nr:MAG: hypothetical protein KatS3mg108_0939 [Isosphaeraceae bacterium]
MPRGRRLIACALAALSAGCGTVKQTGTARTATEQILLTNAWDQALASVDFSPLAGVPVFIDTQYIKGTIDEGWLVSSLRQAMLSQGVLIRSKPEQALWILEPRVGAYGTDSYNWLLGVPQTTVPVTLGGLPAGTIPEIPIIKKSHQQGIAKLALFAYDRASGQLVWRSGTQLAMADAKDVYVGGVGPVQSGSIRQRDKRVGINVPMISDPTPRLVAPSTPGAAPPLADKPQEPPDLPGASLKLPPSTADLDAFAP